MARPAITGENVVLPGLAIALATPIAFLCVAFSLLRGFASALATSSPVAPSTINTHNMLMLVINEWRFGVA